MVPPQKIGAGDGSKGDRDRLLRRNQPNGLGYRLEIRLFNWIAKEIVNRFVLANGADIGWWAANPKYVDVRHFNQANIEMVEEDVWKDILHHYNVEIFRNDQSSQLRISGKLKNVEDAWKDVDETMIDLFYKKSEEVDGIFNFDFHVPDRFRSKLENQEWTILLSNEELFDVRNCIRESDLDSDEGFQLNGPVVELEKLRNELLERLVALEDEIPLRIDIGNSVIHRLLSNFAEKFYELEKRTNTRIRFHPLRQEWEVIYVYIFGKRNDIKACRDELTALDAELRGE
ncbi:hypothetical protein L5515_019695 [Caenorhabditis briggsae]|uniref:Uncharacterized protein n=1 Tax=Caenorhabditis briggsae TaxID=6238 RepID=A0AAE9JU41_CAEBR|nr:hypothetical protein L5515_019695 [Caenorhabditis briggsae]